jgi:transposase-like protein
MIGRPRQYDPSPERLEAFAKPGVSVRDLARQFGFSKTTTHRILARSGMKFARKRGRWVKIAACPKTQEENHA